MVFYAQQPVDRRERRNAAAAAGRTGTTSSSPWPDREKGRDDGDASRARLRGPATLSLASPASNAMLGRTASTPKPDKGTDSENLKYCTKEGDVLVKYGTPESRGETKAQKVIRLALRLRGRDPTSKELQEDAELADVFVDPRTRDALTEIGALQRREDVSSNLRTAFERCKLRPWQSRLLHELKTTRIDERAILWYVDRDGNTGKTWFDRYCEVLEGASVVQATGKSGTWPAATGSLEARCGRPSNHGLSTFLTLVLTSPYLDGSMSQNGHERPADVAERLEVRPAAVHQLLDVLLC